MGARGVGGPRLRRVLLDRVADEPLTIETRALLLASDSELFGGPEAPGGAVVRHRPARLIAVVDRAGEKELRRATSGLDGRWDLVAPIGELDRLARLLPDWRPEPAVIFAPAPDRVVVDPAPGAEVRRIAKEEKGLVDHLTGELRDDLEQVLGRGTVIAAFVDGLAVSFCYAYLETETLWDVAIETLEGYRRRGLASACAERLIAHQSDRGRQPVWAAMEGNTASRSLARRLGFDPVGRLAVLEIGRDDEKQ